jgi:hypothetical protein
MLEEETLLDSGLWIESACSYTDAWVNPKEFVQQTQHLLKAFWGGASQEELAA